MVSYSILHKAYVKIFLHAAKHPHKQVNGVLLGKLDSDVVIIQDVVPLLHHWTSLSPMMEIGLDLVRALLDWPISSFAIVSTGKRTCRISRSFLSWLLPGLRENR